MRLSRFTDDPSPRPFVFAQADRAILQTLDPEWGYPYLPSGFLEQIVPFNDKWVNRRAHMMAREPYKYLENQEPFLKDSVFWITDEGQKKAIQEGLWSEKRKYSRLQYAHEVNSCIVEAALQIASKVSGHDFFRWSDLVAHPNTPKEIRNNPDPCVFHVGNEKIIPDGKPFVMQNERDTIAFFKEIDRGTEPLGGRARITITKKLQLYSQIWKDKQYERFGFHSAMLLFITTKQDRAQNVLDLIEETIGPKPWILVKYYPDYVTTFPSIRPYKTLTKDLNRIARRLQTEPDPMVIRRLLAHEESKRFLMSHDLFYTPWRRAGYADFSLKELAAV